MRVTPQVQREQAVRNLQLHNQRLFNLQAQVSSGLRLTRSSDDPADARAIRLNQAKDLRLDSNLNNINDASTIVNASVDSLLEVRQILTEAHQIGLEANSSANVAAGDSAARASFAEQVDSLLDRLLDAANQKLADGRSLFSGTATDQTSFDVTARDATGKILGVDYQGNTDTGFGRVSRGQTVELFLSGESVFQTSDRGETLLFGNTGAQLGTGTDSAVGRVQLTVTNTGTTFAAGSGVASGTSAATGDTVIGPTGTHVLTISDTSGTGASGTVSLNGGPAVAFTNGDADLKVTGPAGEVVFIDTTAITAGFNGTVDITASGALSIDGGASSVAINFSGNQTVTSSIDGSVVHIDSTGIQRGGEDTLIFTGTSDVFQALINLRNDLLDSGLTEADRSDRINLSLQDLERQTGAVLNTTGIHSARSQNLEALARRTEDVQNAVKQVTNNLESADLSQAILSLQSEQNLFQIGLAISAQVNSLTILNFL